MRQFIFLLIILVIAMVLGLFIAKDPGLALFTYGHWSVEMPLWFFAVIAMAILLCGYFVLRLLGGVDHLFYRFKNWQRSRRKHHSYSKTNRGLIELIEGHWKKAEQLLLEGVSQSDAPLINYLALAKAAHEQAAYDRRDHYLRKAHTNNKDADIAIGLTQAELQFKQGQLEQALVTLNALRALAPRHPLVLQSLERVYIRLGDWKNLLRLCPILYKARVMTKEQYIHLEKKIDMELLKKSSNVILLTEFWESIPKNLRKDPELVLCYAQTLLTFPNQADKVETLLNKALHKEYHKDLVLLYGEVQATDPKKQLEHAEQWLKRYKNHAELLLTLGRICVRCQLWGKARAYFEDSLQLAMSRETLTEYGKLLEYLGDAAMAMQSYRDGLKLCFATSP